MTAESTSRDELVLTFELHGMPGWRQDLVVDLDLSVLTVPLHIGHTLQLNYVTATVTAVVHFFPDKGDPGDVTGTSVQANIVGAPFTEQQLTGALSVVAGLSGFHVPNAPYLKD